MKTDQVEFIVVGTAPEEMGRITVIGRNGNRLIPLNETFDAMVRHRRRRIPEELGAEPVVEEERTIDVRVVAIHAYERSLEALGQGMTGSLSLEGQGVRWLTAGWVLTKRNESPDVPVHPSEATTAQSAGS